MKPEEFVKKVRQSILDENIAIYKDLFETTEVDQASDPYWKEALSLFDKLGDKEKKTLFRIMRQVSVDTISNMFALLDGVSCLEDQDGDFSLTIENVQEQLNGDLQDIFLEIEKDL
ncbi:TPA: hypothetical protein ACX6S1_000369 [Photobacterium damselae]